MLLARFQPPKPALGSPPRCPLGARGKQFKGWRHEKKLNLIRTINPDFKYLAQPWGKMITVHEKMYPVTIECVPQGESWSRAWWPESSEEHLLRSMAAVLRLRAIKLGYAIDLRGASRRMTILWKLEM